MEILEKIKNGKWNGKIYGKENNYSIYVNNEKINISNEEKLEISKIGETKINKKEKENKIETLIIDISNNIDQFLARYKNWSAYAKCFSFEEKKEIYENLKNIILKDEYVYEISYSEYIKKENRKFENLKDNNRIITVKKNMVQYLENLKSKF